MTTTTGNVGSRDNTPIPYASTRCPCATLDSIFAKHGVRTDVGAELLLLHPAFSAILMQVRLANYLQRSSQRGGAVNAVRPGNCRRPELVGER